MSEELAPYAANLREIAKLIARIQHEYDEGLITGNIVTGIVCGLALSNGGAVTMVCNMSAQDKQLAVAAIGSALAP